MVLGGGGGGVRATGRAHSGYTHICTFIHTYVPAACSVKKAVPLEPQAFSLVPGWSVSGTVGGGGRAERGREERRWEGRRAEGRGGEGSGGKGSGEEGSGEEGRGREWRGGEGRRVEGRGGEGRGKEGKGEEGMGGVRGEEEVAQEKISVTWHS